MANKKITVVGDGAEQPLSPEEEQRIEVKVDHMMDPALPDSAPASADAQTPSAAAGPTKPIQHAQGKPAVKKIAIMHYDDTDAEEAHPTPTLRIQAKPAQPAPAKSVPPAKKKAAPKKAKAHDDLASKADAITAAALAAEEQLKQASNAESSESDSQSVEAPSTGVPAPETATADVPGAPVLIQKHQAAPIDDHPAAETALAETPNEPAEPVIESADEPFDEVSDDPASTESATSPGSPSDETDSRPDNADTAGKYRPPAGPLQFKRAEKPLEPRRPGSGARPDMFDADDPLAAAAAATADVEESPRHPFRHTPRPRGKRGRWLIVPLVLLIVVAAVVLVPSLRNQGFKLAHIRKNVTVKVTDAGSNAPLANVAVKLAGASGTTGADGQVTLHGITLGNQQLSATKYAYANGQQNLDVAWRSTTAAALKLKATGSTYLLTVTDVLSGKPVTSAKATSGPAAAVSDNKGVISLVSIPPASGSLAVKVSAGGYIDTTVQLSGSGQPSVALVSSGNDVYVVKQAGKYDIYKTTLDGKDQKLVLAGTGSETSSQALAPNPAGTLAAWVSTRDDAKQPSVDLVDIASGAVNTLDKSDQVKVVGWFKSKLVYVLSKTNASTTDTSRYQLVSYDTGTKQRAVLDHAAYLNDVVSAGGAIYYATGGNAAQLVRLVPGTAKQVLLNSEVSAILQQSYSQLAFATGTKWYVYKLGDAKPTASSQTFSDTSQAYLDSQSGNYSVRLDTSGATNRLILRNNKSGKESDLISGQPGLRYPVRWLGESIVIVRVVRGSTAADYAVSTNGGAMKQVTTVNDTPGLNLWHQ